MRFKDLSSDVFVELGRRYPELKEDVSVHYYDLCVHFLDIHDLCIRSGNKQEVPGAPNTPGSVYDEQDPGEQSSGPGPAPLVKPIYKPSNLSGRTDEQTSLYGSPPHRRRPSQDEHNSRPPFRASQPSDASALTNAPPPQPPPQGTLGYRQETSPEPGPSIQQQQRKPSSDSMGSSYNRRPSQETNTYPLNTSRRSRPSQDSTVNYNQQPTRKTSAESAAFSSSQGPSSATTGVIIPNKSTIAEEEIEVPFGRDESPTSSRPGSADGMRISVNSGSTANAIAQRRQSPDERLVTRSPLDRLGQGGQTFGLGGLNALGAGLLSSPRSEDDETGSDRRGGSEYYDKMSFGRASVASDISGKGVRVRQVVVVHFEVESCRSLITPSNIVRGGFRETTERIRIQDCHHAE